FLVSLKTEDGDEAWRVNREESSQYSTPFVWKNSLRDEIIVGGMQYQSFDPKTGVKLWTLDMNKGRSSATPIAIGDTLYVGNEFRNRGGPDDGGGRLYAVKPGGKGDITPPNDGKQGEFVLWRMDDSGIQMASPTYAGGSLYFLQRRRGILTTVDAKTGEKQYEARVRGAAAFWSSPWTDGENVFALDSGGNTHVIRGGRRFDVVAVNELNQQAWGTPAISEGRIFLRTVDHLYCIE
ncbi:MAG: PQQ-binding-like beta-propeller repeat protein, partial [Planctomycetota bacterium]